MEIEITSDHFDFFHGNFVESEDKCKNIIINTSIRSPYTQKEIFESCLKVSMKARDKLRLSDLCEVLKIMGCHGIRSDTAAEIIIRII